MFSPDATSGSVISGFAEAQSSGMRSRSPKSRRAVAVEVDKLASVDWDAALPHFDDASYDQSACVMDAKWGADHTSQLVVREMGEITGGARLVIITPPGLRRGLAYVKFGPVWRRTRHAQESDSYRAIVGALVDEYCVRRSHCLTILPRPHPTGTVRESEMLADLGFRLRRPMLDPNRYLVDVAFEPEARMKALEQKWRYNLRKALKNGIECRLGTGPDDSATFDALHRAMELRKTIRQAIPLHLTALMQAGLSPAMRPRLMLALHAGVPVAGAIVTCSGDTAAYVFGATSDAGLELKAGYALQWWILGWLGTQNVRWYDLGGEAQEPGLRQFKKGLVGKAGSIVSMPGEYDYWTDIRGRLSADLIYALRDAKRALRSKLSRI